MFRRGAAPCFAWNMGARVLETTARCNGPACGNDACGPESNASATLLINVEAASFGDCFSRRAPLASQPVIGDGI